MQQSWRPATFLKRDCNTFSCAYSWLSKTQILTFLNVLIPRANYSAPWTLRTSLDKKNSRYLEYLGRSNKIVEPLDDFLSFSRTFVLTFWPKFEFFLLKKYITKVFSFTSDVFLRKMVPIKRKLTNKSLGEKCEALKDLENGLSNKDVTTKYGVPRNSFDMG